MGIFRFRIVRLLFYIVCFSISISAMGHNDIYSVDSYKNILDIRYTPYSNDYFTGGFSDSGAWVCFTLPSEDNWVNGFCGPFELDHRLWISDAPFLNQTTIHTIKSISANIRICATYM